MICRYNKNCTKKQRLKCATYEKNRNNFSNFREAVILLLPLFNPWCRLTGVGPPMIAYHFSPSRSRDVAERLLGDYSGTIIRDSYVAYEKLDCEVACCWAHVRRRFLQAVENGYTKAEPLLKLIQALYQIERVAKERAEKKARIRLSFMRVRRLVGNLRSLSGNFLNSAEFSKKRNVRHPRSLKPSLMR